MKTQNCPFNFLPQFPGRRQETEHNLAVGPSRLDFDISEAKVPAQDSELAGYVLNLIQPNAQITRVMNSSSIEMMTPERVIFDHLRYLAYSACCSSNS